MKEQFVLAKALDVILKNSSLQQSNNSHPSNYSTPPIVAYGEENSPEGEVHLRDYWNTIRKRLWLIVGIALIISSIAAIKQARLPDVYQAHARVQVDAETFSPAMGASRGGNVYMDPYMDPEYFNTQVQILTSPTLLRRVAKTLDLEHNTNFLNPPASDLPGKVCCGCLVLKEAAKKLSQNPRCQSLPRVINRRWVLTTILAMRTN